MVNMDTAISATIQADMVVIIAVPAYVDRPPGTMFGPFSAAAALHLLRLMHRFCEVGMRWQGRLQGTWQFGHCVSDRVRRTARIRHSAEKIMMEKWYE
jgi:hypothetical protein